MIAWPLQIPEPAPLTIPTNVALPASYWQTVAVGRWPRRYWLPTSEPTSDGLDGVAIHALATPGPGTCIAGLPDHLWPLAVDGLQIFAVAEDGRIRYIDLEVDQWLTVAADWQAFTDQLQWQPPQLSAPYSEQQLAHALLAADAAALPALFDELRNRGDQEAYVQWLAYLRSQADTTAATTIEIDFALTYLPLTTEQRRHLTD